MELPDISWRNLRSLDGDKYKGFEQLCAQLAGSECDPEWPRVRTGAQDGGVEIYITLPDGSEWAWQAKYQFQLGNSQWQQLDASIKTAIRTHPRLEKYYVCFPIDRADARDGRTSAMDRWNSYCRKWQALANKKGSSIEFIYWGSHELFEKLSEPDNIGTLKEWFSIDRVDKIYFAFFKKWPSRSGRITATAALALLLIGGAYLPYEAFYLIDKQLETERRFETNLFPVRNVLEALKGDYEDCESRFSHQYAFSTEIEECKARIGRDFSIQADSFSPMITNVDPVTFSHIEELFQIIRSFNDRIDRAYTSALGYDGLARHEMLKICPNSPEKIPDVAELRKEGEAAVKVQIETYMVLRDFIVPAVDVASEYADALLNSKKPFRGWFYGKNLKRMTRDIETLVDSGKKYRFYESKYPLSDGLMKPFLDQNFKFEDSSSDELVTQIEDARWARFIGLLLPEAINGNDGALKKLLDCGALREERFDALSKSKPSGEAISEHLTPLRKMP